MPIAVSMIIERIDFCDLQHKFMHGLSLLDSIAMFSTHRIESYLEVSLCGLLFVYILCICALITQCINNTKKYISGHLVKCIYIYFSGCLHIRAKIDSSNPGICST